MPKPLLKLKNDCRVHVEKYAIMADVSKLIRDIPNLGKIKNDPELLKYIVSLVISMIHPKVRDKLKPDELAFEIVCDLFPSMNAEERDMVKKNFSFIVNNNQIDKVSFFKKNRYRVCNFFFKNSAK